MSSAHRKKIEALEDEIDRQKGLHENALEDLREANHVHLGETTKLARELREARDHGLQLERELEASRREAFQLEGVANRLLEMFRHTSEALDELIVADCVRRGIDPDAFDDDDDDAPEDIAERGEEVAHG